MTPAQLLEKLDELLRQPHETEWLEFKEAKNNFDFLELGKYFSALSNEANLKSQPCGWLIFGVLDKDRSICGSHFRPNAADLDSLKHEIARQTTGGITVREIHVIAMARSRFRAKHAAKPFADEIEHWTTEVFLDRAKFTIHGQLTRAALLLLGRLESTHFLSPAVGQMTWKLEADERAYEHFGPPFLLTTSELYTRIRNTIQKIDVPGRLVPYEVPKYDKWVILEALHNALVHQDYSRRSRIIVTETGEDICVESAGQFFEGQVADYTLGQKTPGRYRNRFLVDAMVNINMIDSMGYGIHRMFVEQRKRFYPLPDYVFDDPDKVIVRIPGKIIDPSYTALLMEQHDLPLDRVVLLDQVQKRHPIDRSAAARLRREQLVEGRYPNLYVAAHVAAAAGDMAQYIRNRAFDDQHYKTMIVQYIRQYGQASRENLASLLLDKLSDVLTESQKINKIRNLRKTLVDSGIIHNAGSRKFPQWKLTENLSDKFSS